MAGISFFLSVAALSMKPMEYRRTRIKDRRDFKLRLKLPCWDHENRLIKTDRRRMPDRRTENVIEDEWGEEDQETSS